MPHEHDHGRFWVAGDDASLESLAALMRKVIVLLVLDGRPTSPLISADTLRRHSDAEWQHRTAGPFRLPVVPPGGQWPPEVRVEGRNGPLRVVLPDDLGPEDGVREEVLARWLVRRAEGWLGAA